MSGGVFNRRQTEKEKKKQKVDFYLFTVLNSLENKFFWLNEIHHQSIKVISFENFQLIQGVFFPFQTNLLVKFTLGALMCDDKWPFKWFSTHRIFWQCTSKFRLKRLIFISFTWYFTSSCYVVVQKQMRNSLKAKQYVVPLNFSCGADLEQVFYWLKMDYFYKCVFVVIDLIRKHA